MVVQSTMPVRLLSALRMSARRDSESAMAVMFPSESTTIGPAISISENGADNNTVPYVANKTAAARAASIAKTI